MSVEGTSEEMLPDWLVAEFVASSEESERLYRWELSRDRVAAALGSGRSL